MEELMIADMDKKELSAFGRKIRLDYNNAVGTTYGSMFYASTGYYKVWPININLIGNAV